MALFEMSCKEWFYQGLCFSEKRLNHFRNKEVKVEDLIESSDFKDNFIKTLIDKIKFLDLDSCEKEYKKVFGFNLFEKKKIKNIFRRYYI